ncbi:MAG: Clp protease N-terminal domain-containing protein, partial [Bacteroidaceae bacterium]|nr:Clp protease N-terminal domain-containing protein [Bacteroidaceae bacterium]
MNYKYSERVTRILGYSKEEALRLNNDYIGPEHLMLGIIRDGESRAVDLLKRKFYVNLSSVKEVLERSVRDEGVRLL